MTSTAHASPGEIADPSIRSARLARLASLPLKKHAHPWRWLSGAFIIAALVFVVRAFARGDIEWSEVAAYLFDDRILEGLGQTVQLAVICTLLGTAIGIGVAVMRLSRNPVASSVAWFYVWIFRGTPDLLQLLLWFNLALVFPTLTIPGVWEARTIDVVTPFVAAVIALSISAGAYIAENVRGAIAAVDHGQLEAASALGLPKRSTFRKIVMPQAMPSLIPAIGNHAIILLKLSSLASVISYTELMGSAQEIYYVNARVVELLFTIAIWYLVATSLAGVLQYYLEKWYGRSNVVTRTNSLDRATARVLNRLRSGTKGA
ncbi:amino acid ABC transporter permease [Nocardioides sp. BGMRC 2183]|nr:amino acid ABC transporter permease [Nocardioides sp. BGMRC 2183]